MWFDKFREESRSFIGTIELFSEAKSPEDDSTPSISPYRRWNLIIDAIYSKHLPTGNYEDNEIFKAETAIFRSVSTYRKFHEYLDNESDKLVPGQWVEIELSDEKSATPVWGLNTGTSPDQDLELEGRVYIQRIRILKDEPTKKSVGAAAVASPTKTEVTNKHDLKTIQRKTNSSALQLIKSIKKISSGCIHDVGQASFTTLNCANDMTVFFDVGQPLWFQSFTISKKAKTCLPSPKKKNGDFIILSHWDWDHYAWGRYHPAFHNVPWVAPDQIVGPSAYKFASTLNNTGNLHLIVGAVPTLPKSSPLQLTRDPSNTANRNTSGFIATLKLADKRNILLTADCDYATCKSLLGNTTTFDRVVIPHHGGLALGTMPKTKRSPEVFIVSYGLNNKYGHPVESVLSTHTKRSRLVVGTAKNDTQKKMVAKYPYRQYLACRNRGDIPL